MVTFRYSRWLGAPLTLALASAVVLGSVAVAPSFADNHAERNENMKQYMGANMRALTGAVTQGDAARAAAAAREIAAAAAEAPSWFEGGTPHTDSRSKAEIWQNWDDFVAKTRDTEAAALSVAADADAGTLGDDPREVAGTIGATCGACHRVYRLPED